MDRRTLTAGSMILTGFGVLLPTICPMPQEAKGYLLGVAAIAATTSAAMSAADDKFAPHRQAAQRSQVAALQEQMAANHAYQQAVADSLAQLNLYQWVKAQHPQYHAALLTEHDLWQFEPQPAMVAAAGQNVPAPVSVAIGPGVMQQQSVLAQVEAGTVLDTSWFEDWERRSGIVCGESGDGKTKLLIYVLSRFLQFGRGEVYICDPDYGSSHGDSEPNNWLGLTVGTHIAMKIPDILAMVQHVSNMVDSRADATAYAVSQGQAKPQYEPVLLILDEAPAVMAQLPKDAQEVVKLAIANILRRGLKQNVTFKLGTQTLAVGTLGLTQELLRQIEMVVLYRAAQVVENFSNLGINKNTVDAVVASVCQLPRKVNDAFVCVTYLGKALEIRGIPTLGEINVVRDSVDNHQAAVETHPPVNGDCYSLLMEWMWANGMHSLKTLTRDQCALVSTKFSEITGTRLSESGLRALLEYLEKVWE